MNSHLLISKRSGKRETLCGTVDDARALYLRDYFGVRGMIGIACNTCWEEANRDNIERGNPTEVVHE